MGILWLWMNRKSSISSGNFAHSSQMLYESLPSWSQVPGCYSSTALGTRAELQLVTSWCHSVCMEKGLAYRKRAAARREKNPNPPPSTRAKGNREPKLEGYKKHHLVSSALNPSSESSSMSLGPIPGFHYRETWFYQPTKTPITSGHEAGKGCKRKSVTASDLC